MEAAPPFVHPQLRDAVIVPGSGPHAIDYAKTGAPRWACCAMHDAWHALHHHQRHCRYACLALSGGREVIVGRKAGEAVMRGAHVFVPGMLAVSAGETGLR